MSPLTRKYLARMRHSFQTLWDACYVARQDMPNASPEKVRAVAEIMYRRQIPVNLARRAYVLAVIREVSP